MKTRRILGLPGAILLLASPLPAQAVPDGGPDGGSATKVWEVSVTADGYAVPHAEFYVSPVVTADHGSLHLEGRYNYENQRTGSIWVGYNFTAGSTVQFRFTPILGGVFGETAGIAPGCEISLSYKRLTFSSSQEYVFDTKASSGSFFYSWPQLTYSPREWIHFGIVAQRTKAYHTGLDTQRGVFAGISHKKVSFTTYIFNAGWTDPTVVVELVYSR
jgi:hypothetical protein